jgi:hypothetical protein
MVMIVVMFAIVVFQISVNESRFDIFVVHNFELDVLLKSNCEIFRMSEFNVKMHSGFDIRIVLLEIILVLFAGPRVFTLYGDCNCSFSFNVEMEAALAVNCDRRRFCGDDSAARNYSIFVKS